MVRNRTRWALAAAITAVALLTACGGNSSGTSGATEGHVSVPATPAVGEASASNALCLTCHDQPGVTVKSGWGQRQLDTVAASGYYVSAHGELPCTRCHEDQSSLPHARFAADGRPLGGIADSSAVCQSCHPGAFERFLDSVHGTVIRLGDERAPGCTDCHTTHYVRPIETWTASAKAESCAKCHDGAQTSFAGSLTHREPSADRLPVDYLATRFFGALVIGVVGIGILHVELDLLRWLRNKVSSTKREGGKR